MPPTPPVVKLGALDLNLLVVFDAVMQERNVTRAGQRLGLSQPAMSHALSRLRHMLKDDLFIRTPKGMLPTPRAEQLAVPVRRSTACSSRLSRPSSTRPKRSENFGSQSTITRPLCWSGFWPHASARLPQRCCSSSSRAVRSKFSICSICSIAASSIWRLGLIRSRANGFRTDCCSEMNSSR
jgi:hypothetical protein